MREAVEKKVLSENDRLAAALRHAIVTKEFCASTWSARPAPAKPRC